jgi:hypothetical protein
MTDGIKTALFSFLLLFIITGCSGSESSSVSAWPGGIIPYRFASANEGQRTIVLSAMSEWECGTSIRFVECADSSVEILTIGFYDAAEKNRATIGFARNAHVRFSAGALRLTVLHELGHVIGLQHEHQRADRDEHINLPSDICSLTGWAPDDVKKLGEEDFLYDSRSFPYDYPTIMAYHSPLITDKTGAVVVSARCLTETDIAKVNAIYPGERNLSFEMAAAQDSEAEKLDDCSE